MKGWHNESYRHSLAARGIPTKMDLKLIDDSAMKWLRTSAIEHSLTPELETLFLSTEDPEELNNLMKEYETEMANNRNRYVGRDWGPYLVCDDAVEIMSYILKRKGIDHEVLMDFSDTGDTHVWLRVDNINYDPTEQGMHEGQMIAKWDDRKGKSEHFDYIDIDDEKAYWKAVVVIDGSSENVVFEFVNDLYEESRAKPNLCGKSETMDGYWVESHTIGCRDAADEHPDDWWENHYKIYDEYKNDGISEVIGDPETGAFVTVTPLDGGKDK